MSAHYYDKVDICLKCDRCLDPECCEQLEDCDGQNWEFITRSLGIKKEGNGQ